MLHAEVIIPLGVKDSFTYLVPEALAPTVGIGKLVVVPFGKKEWYTGVVCALWEADGKNDKIKMITHVVDGEFALSPAYLRFLRWVSEYYMASLGMVVRAALPVSLRLESGGYLRFLEKVYDESENALSDGEMEFMRRLERALGRDMCHDGKLFRLDEIYAVMAQQGMSDFSMIYSLVKKGVVEIQETEYRTYRPKWEKIVAWGRTFSERELHEVLDSLKRAKAQYALLCNWIDYCGRHDALLGRKAFAAQISPSASALKALCDRGVLRILDMEASRLEDVGGGGEDVHSLTPLQREVMEKIRALFQEKDCVLLQGVTSSGKTEIYIHLIRKALEQGKQVLYLLPEIGLTVQLVRRLRRVFGRQVGIYHSGLSDGARAEMWRKQNGSDPYPIVLGVRSSIFLPFRALGLVIVDEEHDPSYKQQEPAPRYNGRDAAVMLGRLCGAKILLGSATPSLESFRNVESGKYGFVDMKGHLVIPTEYDWAGSFDHIKLYGKWYIASPVSVQQRKWLIDSNNQPITSPIDIDKQYFIINDKLWVKQEQGYALVNLKWETLLQTDYQYIVNDRIHRPENVFLVKKQDYFGAIRVCDNNREQIILPF